MIRTASGPPAATTSAVGTSTVGTPGVGTPGVGTAGAGTRGESLGDFLRDQRRTARLSLRQLAERAEVSNPYLSQVERGLRQPSAQVLTQIARGLRISAHALYVRAGLLGADEEPSEVRADTTPADRGAADEAPVDRVPGVGNPVAATRAPAGGVDTGPLGVPTAVRADPHLLDRHKQLLLDLYDTFCRDAAAVPALPRRTA